MGAEHRRFFRITQPFPAQCRLHSDIMSTSWIPVIVLNLSAVGVRLRSEEPIDAGTSLEVQWQLPSMPAPVIVCGRVVWSQMQASRVSEHGVEFVDVTQEQALQIDQVVQFLKKGA